MRKNDFFRIYTKAKMLNDYDDIEYSEEDTINEKQQFEKYLNGQCISSSSVKLLENRLVSQEKITKDDLVFNIFILKFKDIKTFDDKNKYNYLVSMIINYEEVKDNVNKAWEINDIMAIYLDDVEKANKHYKELINFFSSNSLEYIIDKIDEYLDEKLKNRDE